MTRYLIYVLSSTFYKLEVTFPITSTWVKLAILCVRSVLHPSLFPYRRVRTRALSFACKTDVIYQQSHHYANTLLKRHSGDCNGDFEPA